jgi:hypothetical protein
MLQRVVFAFFPSGNLNDRQAQQTLKKRQKNRYLRKIGQLRRLTRQHSAIRRKIATFSVADMGGSGNLKAGAGLPCKNRGQDKKSASRGGARKTRLRGPQG